MKLIDRLHNAGIGAIIDFVPVHFAVDAYGLMEFDGTALYEYPHTDVGESEWGSYNFMHSHPAIACFLQSAAHYWLKEYHFDGLRFDAVSRLIYWQGDERRGVNGSAMAFVKKMNQGLHTLHPTAMLREWDESREVDWHLTENADHADFLQYITDLNQVYCETPALRSLDHSCEGFKWVDSISDNPCVFGYTRTDGKDTVLVLPNFSNVNANLTLDQSVNAALLLST